MYKYYSGLLRSKEAQDRLIDVVSGYVLNYCNNIYDICYGLALGELEDDCAPFPFCSEGLGDSHEQIWEKYEYFTEEKGAYHSDIIDAIQNALMDVLKEKWPLVIAKRMAIESQFQNPEEFVALRKFMIVLNEAGITFYTKAPDGGGPDMIEGTITTDLVHSDYESRNAIITEYSYKELINAMKGYKSSYTYNFANLNSNITSANKSNLGFFGPVQKHPFYRFINRDNKKQLFIEALTNIAERLSLPMSLDLKFEPRNDHIVFNVTWERKLPEIFYDISNHTRDNRFS